MLLSRTRILGRKRIMFATATVAALLVLGVLSMIGPASRTFGQSPHSANAAQHGVAVVDISFIFKNHTRFKNSMDAMKKEMDNIELQLKAERDQISKIEEERNKFNIGTEQYKQADERLARSMADFNLKMTSIRKDFLDREAKEYYKTYLEIVDAVSRYATTRNIGMVIRFNGDPVDPNRREDVLREINKPVVFQNRVDITPDVLASLNRDGGIAPTQTPGPTTPGVATRPQGGAPLQGNPIPGQGVPSGPGQTNPVRTPGTGSMIPGGGIR